MSGAQGGQKRELDPQEPELQMDVSHHVCARIQTQVLSRSNQYS